MKPRADFRILNAGSLIMLTPVTAAAREWVEAHLPHHAQQWGGAVAIEPRYIGPILDGIMDEGLVIYGSEAP